MIRIIVGVAIALLIVACGNTPYSIALQEGPNLGVDGLGVVYLGATMPVEDAVASILPQLVHGSVQYWNGSAWLVWTPDAAYDTLLTLEHGKPYAITLKAKAIWTGEST